MKILFFVDVHESNAALNKLKEKAKKADLIICAGDISIFERGLKGLLEKINSFGKETLIINGNHEEAKVMAKLCVNYDNITFIHKKIIQRAEFTILGYGGGGFSQVDHEFDRFASEHSKDLANKKIIFVSHGPPYGTALDKLGKEHYGNKNYRRFIDCRIQ